MSPGEVRQWRKVIPYLASKPGKAARFSFSDLVGLAIAGDLARTMGVRISEISGGLNSLFEALSEARPVHLEGLVAIVEKENARLLLSTDLTARHIGRQAFVIPCDPIIAEIGARMMPVAPGAKQTSLPFRPVALRGGG